MSKEDKEQIDFLLEYLKNEENTRRIKTITISEAELLLDYIQQKENIIKEVREYIRNNMIMYDNIEAEVEDILILLDKGE